MSRTEKTDLPPTTAELMPKPKPKRASGSRERWEDWEIGFLSACWAEGVPAAAIAADLDRTPEAVWSKASELTLARPAPTIGPHKTGAPMDEELLGKELIRVMPMVTRRLVTITGYSLEECEDHVARAIERTLLINRRKPGAIDDGPIFFAWLLYLARSEAFNYRRYRGEWARRTSSIDLWFDLATSESVEATVLTRIELEPILARSRTDLDLWYLVTKHCGFGPVEMGHALGVPDQLICYRSMMAQQALRRVRDRAPLARTATVILWRRARRSALVHALRADRVTTLCGRPIQADGEVVPDAPFESVSCRCCRENGDFPGLREADIA